MLVHLDPIQVVFVVQGQVRVEKNHKMKISVCLECGCRPAFLLLVKQFSGYLVSPNIFLSVFFFKVVGVIISECPSS